MNTELKAILSILALALAVSPAMGYYFTLTLGQYNVTLNMGDEDVTVSPQPTKSDMDSVIRSAKLQGPEESDWGVIYIFEYQSDTGFDLQDNLRGLLKVYCTFPDVDSGIVAGMGGAVGTGTARVAHGVGKQECYAGAANLPGSGSRRDIVLFGHFTNQTLNEQFVSDAKIEYRGMAPKVINL
jgi:hypothetical protein